MQPLGFERWNEKRANLLCHKQKNTGVSCNCWACCDKIWITIRPQYRASLCSQQLVAIWQSWRQKYYGIVGRFERSTRQAMYVWGNMEVRLCNCCCSGKAVRVTHSEIVFVALGSQPVMSMRLIVRCGLSGSTIFFQITSQKARFSRKCFRSQTVFWFSLLLLSRTFLIVRRIERDITRNIFWSSCVVPVILVGF